MTDRRWRIHWAWLPAAVVAGTIVALRHGWWVAVLAAVAGLTVGLYAEWRARRRTRRGNNRTSTP